MKPLECDVTTCEADRDMSRRMAAERDLDAVRIIDTPASAPADWSEMGRRVLSEAMRQTTSELLRREEAIACAARAAQREVLS